MTEWGEPELEDLVELDQDQKERMGVTTLGVLRLLTPSKEPWACA